MKKNTIKLVIKNMQKKATINLILICIFVSLSLTCCKKNSSGGSTLERYFESNVLNKNIVVSFASEGGADITANYSGYTFLMLKTDFYHGPLQATKNSMTTTGSWSSNDDYSKLAIVLPDVPSEFTFLTREWRFTSKTSTLMKLAPWGSSAPLVLHMKLQ